MLWAGSAAAKTLYVDPGGSDSNNGESDTPFETITHASSKATAGDTVVIRDGTYSERITVQRSGSSGKWITFKAANTGKAIVDAKGLSAALVHGNKQYIIFDGLIFRNANNFVQPKNAMVRPGNNWVLRNCTMEYAQGAGLGIKDVDRVQVVGCKIQYNGQLGIGGSYANDVLIQNTLIKGNNRGFDSKPDVNVNGKDQTVQYNGKWYIKPGFEAGGTKFNHCKNWVVDGVTSLANNGPGLWFDYGNENNIIRNCRFYRNKRLDASWHGIGLFIEFNKVGGFVIENNRIYDNDGPGISIGESRNVVVRNNQIKNDVLQFRDMASRSSSSIYNVQITNNIFENSMIGTSTGTWTTTSGSTKNISIDRNVWVGQASYNWGNKSYNDLNTIRSALGFDRNGKITNSGTPLDDPTIEPEPEPEPEPEAEPETFVPAVLGFSLINTATGKPVAGYANFSGIATLDLAELPEGLNLRANTNESTQSVRFDYNGKTAYRVEYNKPFALAGDTGDRFNEWDLSEGTHHIGATPYSQTKATGQAGPAAGLTVTVIRSVPEPEPAPDPTPVPEVTPEPTPTPDPEPAPSPTPDPQDEPMRVMSFSLIDVSTGRPVKGYASVSGEVQIDLAALPKAGVSVRANVAGDVGSVRFSYNGKSSYSVENNAPYAIAGDDNNNTYHAWKVGQGDHTVSAMPFIRDKAQGKSGTAASMTLRVVPSEIVSEAQSAEVPRIASFSLIDIATGRPVARYSAISGAVTLDLAELPRGLNLRANVNDAAQSVRFDYNGKRGYRIEYLKPFALAGDTADRYDLWNLKPGVHRVQATGYTGDKATGEAGPLASLTLTVVRNAAPSAPADSDPAGDAEPESEAQAQQPTDEGNVPETPAEPTADLEAVPEPVTSAETPEPQTLEAAADEELASEEATEAELEPAPELPATLPLRPVPFLVLNVGHELGQIDPKRLHDDRGVDLRKFGVLRFTDWQIDLETGALAHPARSARAVALCNTLKADLWISLPYNADQAAMINVARWVQGQLDPDRLVYVEFGQTLAINRDNHARLTAMAQGNGLSLSDFLAKGARQSHQAFAEVLGRGRVVRVLASPSNLPAFAEAFAEACNGDFDVLATGLSLRQDLDRQHDAMLAYSRLVKAWSGRVDHTLRLTAIVSDEPQSVEQAYDNLVGFERLGGRQVAVSRGLAAEDGVNYSQSDQRLGIAAFD